MAITLFPHNAEAYEAAVQMLAETGKACVIHPTGTGKSFIGFKYCEDHPERSVLWLSPSEYIFRTQLENVEATMDWTPQNIGFCTYARLMLMNEAEISALEPEAIILDELHRAGAPCWQEGVERLFAAFPAVPRLGLTATNIRYLDNQRDMAEELFDGCVASEITLGEAIARGILSPPKYVLSVFSYQNELEKYERRIRTAKSRAARDAANEYFEALRRAIEKAEGLDAVFQKHMTARNGKYLVFCATVEHMDEMIAKVPEWFSGIDPKPHVYRVYANDPGASRAFAQFKADNSEHLKLLFSIDMLNEGVHVDDVDGVILFRPTVSPTVYKQQIGRAMSASKKKDAVIFDIVNNIENLYAIGAIEQEMRVVMNYYRDHGEGGEIVNDSFQVFDEVRDVRELFEKLNDTLSASWNLMYRFAEDYYREHGDLEVPKRYKTPEGYSLGSWIYIQRKIYNGDEYGNLTQERIRKLEAIGMTWEGVRNLSWNRFYAEAERYFKEKGHLRVPYDYVSDTGLRLGSWITNQRLYRKGNIRAASLTPERIAALDAIGMIWDVPDYLWVQNYAAACEYHRAHGDLMVPKTYVTTDGIRLGQWIANLRSAYSGNRTNDYRFKPEQIRQLEAIDMCWNPQEQKWENGFSHAESYVKRFGKPQVPASFVSEDGFALGTWIRHQRQAMAEGRLSPDRAEKLEALGLTWEKVDPWEFRFELAAAYFRQHGDLNIPGDYRPEGIWLAKWLNEQRQIRIGKRTGKTLTDDQISKLDAIGMEWGKRSQSVWSDRLEDAKAYYETHGNLLVPQKYSTPVGKKLGNWIKVQRKQRKKGALSSYQIKALDAIGMVWELDDPWEIGFAHAKVYADENGHLNVPVLYECEDGYKLGRWISNQRSMYTAPTQSRFLTAEQISRLESLGIVWQIRELQWQEGYWHALEYMRILNGQPWKSTYLSPDGFKTGAWIRSQMRIAQRGGMTEAHREKLRSAGLLEQTTAASPTRKMSARRGDAKSEIRL